MEFSFYVCLQVIVVLQPEDFLIADEAVDRLVLHESFLFR
jgi:hypothetical protein